MFTKEVLLGPLKTFNNECRMRTGVLVIFSLPSLPSTSQAQPEPRGAAVSTADGEFVTLVQEGSQVFLPDVLDRRELWVSAPGQPRCRLSYALPERGDPEVYFETAPARCQP